jgi:hypothetical protein
LIGNHFISEKRWVISETGPFISEKRWVISETRPFISETDFSPVEKDLWLRKTLLSQQSERVFARFFSCNLWIRL